jgi:hypothetical protein
LYKDKEKAKQEVARILRDLGCDDNQRIDYTRKEKKKMVKFVF